MKPKTIAVGGLLALVALAMAAVIAANPLATQAAGQDTPQSQVASPDDMGNPQMAEDEEPSAKPYIGIYIAPDPDGGVMVLKVMEDSPSHGVLQEGDVITAVDSETVNDSTDLIDAVAVAGVGGTVTLTITRDGQSQDVDVTVGEHEASFEKSRIMKQPFTRNVAPRDRRMFTRSRVADDRFSSSRLVIADDDGNYKTHRTVAGTVTSVDADAGTFTLQPKDGSATIDYAINDDTVVTMNRTGDLGSLNTTDPTLVMDVDGEVKRLHQGNRDMSFDGDRAGRFERGRNGSPFFDRGPRRHGERPQVFFHRLLDDKDVMDLLPSEVRERIERLRSGNNRTPPEESGDSF